MNELTANPDPDPHLRLTIQPHADVVPCPGLGPDPGPDLAAKNPRKKRTKLLRPNPNPPMKRVKKPEITMPCSECGKRFWSWKALFGHMRCHPERQWRGINPPTKLRSPSLSLPRTANSQLSEEESNVAACLLLLASSAETETEAEAERFECGSCKKVFGSHQALGGHRASHKNVKGCFAMGNDVDAVSEAEGERAFGFHTCGICLRSFPSGQALGGHKRCHWERGGFDGVVSPGSRALDLNLPPGGEEQEEDDRHYCSTSSSSSAMALDLRLTL